MLEIAERRKMKFYMRYFDLDDVDDDMPPTQEGMIDVQTSHETTLSIVGKDIVMRFIYDTMVIDSDWQPNNCIVFWGFIQAGANRFKRAKIELYKTKPKQKEAK